jgi:GntR family transcriptional regulator
VILYIYDIYSIYARKNGDSLNLIISNSSGRPIYEQITDQIKACILSGELSEGEALPSMRALAKDLHISVITTKRAYEDLERDGFVVVVAGKGCFVAPRNLELMREEKRKQVEQTLERAVEQAKAASITLEELGEMLSLLYED